MDASFWDQRYAGAELVWSTTPNQWVAECAADLAPGVAVDLGAGEGRNALWLAERGWQVTAVDFSAVGLERARSLAGQRLGADSGRFGTQVADLLEYRPEPVNDLVLVVYLQLPPSPRRTVLAAAAGAVAPGGLLLVVAHDSQNREHGHGGPQNPDLLYTAQDVVADVGAAGLPFEPVRVERVVRTVRTPDGEAQALDALALLRRA